MPNPAPQPGEVPDHLNSLLGDVVIPGDSATVTVDLPQRVVQHGDSLEIAASLSLDDPTRATAEIINLVAQSLSEVFLGKKGDQLPMVLTLFLDLSVWRLGIRAETGAGQSHPASAEQLDAAAVALLQVLARYGRARAVVDLERLKGLPVLLGVLRFRKQILKALRGASAALERGIIAVEVEIDERVRDAYERLESLRSLPSLWEGLEPVRRLISGPAEKGQVTRRLKAEARSEGVAAGRAEEKARAPRPAPPATPPVIMVSPPAAAAPAPADSPAPPPEAPARRTRAR